MDIDEPAAEYTGCPEASAGVLKVSDIILTIHSSDIQQGKPITFALEMDNLYSLPFRHIDGLPIRIIIGGWQGNYWTIVGVASL